MSEIAVQKEKQGFSAMLAYPEFLKLFLGQTVSRLGDSIDSLALVWMVYKLTDSPLNMAVLMFFNALPSLLFGFFAGVFVDRWDRKRLLIWSDLFRGGMVALIAYLYMVKVLVPWHLFACTFLISTSEVFSGPARSAVVPELVEKRHLMTANSLFSTVSSICEIVGMGIASAILGTLGIAAAIFIDALSFWFCAMMTIFTRIPKLPTKKEKLNLKQYRIELKEGFDFIRGTRIVFICIILIAFTNFSLAPVGVIFPIFSDKLLHAGPSGFALMAATLSVGTLIGALLVGQFGDRIKRKSRMIQIGIGGIGISFFLLGFTSSVWLAALFCWIAGFSLPMASISFDTIVQQHTPSEKMGRVSGFGRTLAMGGTPLGIMIAGALAETISTDHIFQIVGFLVLITITIISLSKDFRKV